MLSRFLIIVTILLSSVTLALFSGNNIDIPSLVNGPAEADVSALSSSSGSISNKTVDIPAISASKIKFSIYDIQNQISLSVRVGASYQKGIRQLHNNRNPISQYDY